MATETDVPDIAKELKKLTAARASKKQESAVLFNLVIYVQDDVRVSYFKDIYKSIAQRYPCRILFIHSDSKLKTDLFEVKVEEEDFTESGRTISSDLISIHTSQSHLDCLPFVVIPNLVADTPTYLLWGQDPSIPNSLLTQLEPHAKRLIFDSECSANLQNLSRKLLREHGEGERIGKVDLNWIITTGWRDVLFSLFNTEEKIKQLKRAHTINITYNKADSSYVQHGNIPSIYLQGWLAKALDWKFISKTNENTGQTVHLTYHTGEGRVEVFLNGQTLLDESIPGAITAIEITTHEEEAFMLQRQGTKVTVHISTPDRCELPVIFRLLAFKRGYTFLKEVFYKPITNSYYDMLTLIEKIEWHS